MPNMTEEQKQQTREFFDKNYKERDSVKEEVNHPAHYGGKDNPYEVVKIAEATGLDKDAYLFNVLKYIIRADHKLATTQDLKKAQWYLNRRIQLREGAIFHVLENQRPKWEPNPMVSEIVDSDYDITDPHGLDSIKTPAVILNKQEILKLDNPELLRDQIKLWYQMADSLFGSLALVIDQGSLSGGQETFAKKACDQFKQYNEAWHSVKEIDNSEFSESHPQGY